MSRRALWVVRLASTVGFFAWWQTVGLVAACAYLTGGLSLAVWQWTDDVMTQTGGTDG